MTVLCNLGITTALTASIQTPVPGFGKPVAMNFFAKFTYAATTGSSTATTTAWIEMTPDGGTNWADIACFEYGAASASGISYQSCNGTTAVNATAALTEGSLSNNTSINGLLGDQYRVKVTTTGTYGAGTSLVINGLPH